jgi:hypothetical protein
MPFWPGNQKKALLSLLEAAQGGQIDIESTAGGIEEFYQTLSGRKKGRRRLGKFLLPMVVE